MAQTDRLRTPRPLPGGREGDRVPKGVRAAQHALVSPRQDLTPLLGTPRLPAPPFSPQPHGAVKALYRGRVPLGGATLYLVRHKVHQNHDKHWVLFGEKKNPPETSSHPMQLPPLPPLPSLVELLSAPGEQSLSERTAGLIRRRHESQKLADAAEQRARRAGESPPAEVGADALRGGAKFKPGLLPSNHIWQREEERLDFSHVVADASFKSVHKRLGLGPPREDSVSAECSNSSMRRRKVVAAESHCSSSSTEARGYGAAADAAEPFGDGEPRRPRTSLTCRHRRGSCTWPLNAAFARIRDDGKPDSPSAVSAANSPRDAGSAFDQGAGGGEIGGGGGEGNDEAGQGGALENEVSVPTTKEDVIRLLSKVNCFAPLTKEQVEEAFSRGFVLSMPRYCTIYREGILGSSFFVVLRGKVKCTSSREEKLIRAGECFGEESLVMLRRTHTMTTMDECELMQFEAKVLEDLPLDLVDVRAEVVSQALSKTVFFKPLSHLSLVRIARITEMETFGEFENIFREGDRGDKMYIVVDGKVCLHIGQRGVGYVSSLTERNWFGELALLNSAARTASATCVDPTRVLTVSRDNFKALLEMMPALKSLFKSDSNAITSMNRMKTRRNSAEKLFHRIQRYQRSQQQKLAESAPPETATSPATNPNTSPTTNDTKSAASRRQGFFTLDMKVSSFQGAKASVVVDGMQQSAGAISPGK